MDSPGFFEENQLPLSLKILFSSISLLHGESWISFPMPVEPGSVFLFFFLFSLWDFFFPSLFSMWDKAGT